VYDGAAPARRENSLGVDPLREREFLNGYAGEVAALYRGRDLRRSF
jgi:hypothetical protein